MTTHKLSMADLPKFFLGFDRLENDFFASTVDGGYPVYNVVKAGEDDYRVEIAVPGWHKDDIEIFVSPAFVSSRKCMAVVTSVVCARVR